MYPPVDTKDSLAVEAEVQRIQGCLFPHGGHEVASRSLAWARDWFSGRGHGHQAVDVHYHDFEHTLQGLLCLVRLLAGRHRAGAAPPITQRTFELAMLAILLHDTGYLKKRNDTQGTGAKFTPTHVRRSVEFAALTLPKQGFAPVEIWAVQNMIRCTGLHVDVNQIAFSDPSERLAGMAVGTADLLGQMAAAEYVTKLPTLYTEFQEARRFTDEEPGAFCEFSSAEDLMRKTPLFWENCVLPRITRDFEGLYRFLNDPYPDGPNPYLQQIAANLERLRERLANSQAT